ncbi:LysR substrate-binding domain-containing protein [Sandaracinobacter sp. RS1-74]|uniref:hydrogen peroxide-inducible genes activator n=1 Tax=Sandaracinobacteroides sayramensis TaxID=2913411 RepID=UPI001EDC4B35|nr:hydrogen peroxide-inducible genes activator [Sandaracinobacteroides sayramensis]MCG2840035.1 LysR substrate-binding domain-containing protein [Sandaracinobacteroides sayramensis]
MIYMPTIKQLQYLVALQRSGHFGKAAEACYVTQSTLSAGIRELETLLGVTLVERNRRVVRFTPLGEQVVKRAWRLLAEADAIAELARAAGKPLASELRLGVIPTIAPFLLPAMLPELRARWPELKLFLREEQSGPACEALARGQLDCLLLALPYGCGDIEYEPLFEDPIRLAFHPGDFPHPPALVDPQGIDETRLLLLEDGHCLKDHALAACSRATFRPDQSVLGTSLHTLVQMVENRIGMTLLPQMAIDAGILANTAIETRPLASPEAKREIALAWRPSSPRAEEYRLFAKALQDARRPR